MTKKGQSAGINQSVSNNHWQNGCCCSRESLRFTTGDGDGDGRWLMGCTWHSSSVQFLLGFRVLTRTGQGLGFKLRVFAFPFVFFWVFCPLHDATSFIAKGTTTRGSSSSCNAWLCPICQVQVCVCFFTKKFELQCSNQSFFFFFFFFFFGFPFFC